MRCPRACIRPDDSLSHQVVLAAEILYVFILMYTIYREVRKIHRDRREYFSHLWNIYEVSHRGNPDSNTIQIPAHAHAQQDCHMMLVFTTRWC